MKVICPVPFEIQIAQDLSPLAAAFARDCPANFLPNKTAQRLMDIELKAREYHDKLKLWSHEKHGVDYERVVANFKKNPTPENEAAFLKVGSRQDHAVEYSRMRTGLTRGLQDFMKDELLPLALPLLRRGLDAIEKSMAEFEEEEKQWHELFRIPPETRQEGRLGKMVPVPHIIVREILRMVKGQCDMIALAQGDADHPIGHYQGPTMPSSLLKDFIYFED